MFNASFRGIFMKKYIMTTALALVLGTAAFSSAQAVVRQTIEKTAVLQGNIAPGSNQAGLVMQAPRQALTNRLILVLQALYPQSGVPRTEFTLAQLGYSDPKVRGAGLAQYEKFARLVQDLTFVAIRNNYQPLTKANLIANFGKYGLTDEEVQAILAELRPLINTPPIGVGSGRPEETAGQDQKMLLLGLFLLSVALIAAYVGLCYATGGG
jgi:hypothetical protein